MANNQIRGMTCGILFNHSFSLLDSWGAIADNILFKCRLFPNDYFPDISDLYTVNRVLSNSKTGSFIRINQNNLVYYHAIEKDFEAEYEEVYNRIAKLVIPEIITKYNLVTRRIGFVFDVELTDKEIEDFISKHFGPTQKNISDLRFSKKETTKAGLLWSDKADYINKIYNVGSIKEYKGISYDYQQHFVPPRADVRDILPSFLKDSRESFFLEILNCGGKME